MSPRESSPEALLARHRAGADGALEELIAQLTPQMRQFARRLGADPQQSEDIVQELWLDVLATPNGYDAQRPLVPWLRGMVRQRVRSLQRRERRIDELVRHASSERFESADLSERSAARESEAFVRRALKRLPPHYQAPLELHLLEGLTPLEVSQQLALPRASVRVLLHRGRAMLRSSLPRGLFALLLSLLFRTRARAATSAVAAAAAVMFVLTIAAQRSDPSPNATSLGELAAAASLRAEAAEVETRGTAPGERALAPFQRELEVRVLDADGHPAANVGLVLEPLDGSDPRLHRVLASTDATGHARLPHDFASTAQLMSGLGADARIEPDTESVELRVDAGVAVRGFVRDMNGAPLANAEIWLGDARGDRRGQVVAHTDEHGEYGLAHAPRTASLAAFASGHRRTAMARIPQADEQGVAQLDLIASPGGASVRVSICDELGAPIPFARVFVGKCVDGDPPHLARGILPSFPPPIVGVADEHGVLIANGLEPGAHPIVARAVGFAPSKTVVQVSDGEFSDARLMLAHGAALRGSVVDDLGQPLTGAQVALRADDPLCDIDLSTSKSGEFVAEGVPLGAVAVAARAWNHDVAESRLFATSEDSEAVELVLARTPLCRGTLTDDRGEPLSGYRLRVLGSPSSPLSANSDEGVVDELGAFELAVIGGQLRRIEVRAPHWPQWLVVRREWLLERAPRLDITLPRAAEPRSWLVGVIRDADGRALANRQLDIADPFGAVSTRVATTSERGEFRIGPLLPGRYSIVLAHSGRADQLGPVGVAGEFDIGPDAEREVSIELERPIEWRCALRFSDAGAPSSPIVSLDLPNGGPGVLSWNEPDQRADLLPGRYALHAMGDDFEWWSDVEIAVSENTPPGDLAPLVRASPLKLSIVTLPSDTDFEAGVLVTRDPDGERVGRFALADGAERATLQAFLAHGAYRASVLRRDGTRSVATFDVGPCGARPSDLRFDR